MNMNTQSDPMKTLRRWLLVLWLTLLLPAAAVAEEIVGRVVSAVGEVLAVRPDSGERALQRRSEIHAGDTLVTGADGRLQVRFVDDGLVDLRPESELVVEAYSGPTDDEGGSAVMEFTRGAMRTLTGTIGQEEGDDYRLETTPASIGIRGTDYALQYCDDACVDAGGEAGLYGRVSSGAITVSNLAGTIDFEAGQFFSVADRNTLPALITTPPPTILDGTDDGDSSLPLDANGDIAEPTFPVEIPGVEMADPRTDFAGIGRTFIASEANPEPLDTSALEEEPEPELEPLPEVEAVMAGAGFGYGGEFFGGLIRRDDDSVQDFTTNSDTQSVLSALFDSATGFEVIDPESANLNMDDSWTSPDGSANVYWGSWSASSGDIELLIEGDTSSPTIPWIGFLHSEDITTPEQLAELSGSVTYNTVQGLLTASSIGTFANFSENTTELTVDFTTLEAGITMALEGNQFGDSISYDIDSGMQSVELFLLELDLEGTWTRGDGASGVVDGDLAGQFVSDSADGVIISFEFEQLQDGDLIEAFIGSQLLTPDN